MKIFLVTETELQALVEKIELLTLQAKDYTSDSYMPIDRLHRSIHYHVTEWVQEMKKAKP